MKKLCLIIFSFLIVQTAFNQNFLFNEDFNDFIDWKYSPDNNIGAKFKILDEVLSVNNFGTQQGEWYGPIAVKQLSSKLDVSYDDFIFSTYLISTDNIADAFGLIWIVLVDDDNTPILGVYWSDNYHDGIGMNSYRVKDPLGNNAFSRSYLGIYADGIIKEGSELASINGKVSLKKSSGQLSLHYNDGPALTTYTFATKKIATKLKIYILKYKDFPARNIKIDFIRLIKK